MRPIIGLTCSHDTNQDRAFLPYAYIDAIEQGGGIPLLLPIIRDTTVLSQILNRVDGLVFTGGVDVDPFFQGSEPLRGLGQITPERDAFEIELARLALARDMGILAICRGMQLINIAAGGSVYQDINTEVTNIFKHSQDAPRWYPTHKINLKAGSQLAAIFQGKEMRVNSFHHQAVARVASGFQVTAWAADGIIEAIESENHKFVIGIQSHPEAMWQRNPHFLRLFKSFVDAVR